MRHHVAFLALAVGLACRPESRDTPAGGSSSAPTEQVITIAASDFAFAAPDTVLSGYTRLEFVNRSRTLHHAMLLRATDGHTLQEAFDALSRLAPGAPLPSWLHEAGGLNPPEGADTARAIVRLESGRYVLVCYINMPDEVPHFMKGMIRELIVKPASAAAEEPPRHDSRLIMREYDFGVVPALRAGRQLVRVENAGVQAHEFTLVRLAPGKRLADLERWMATGFTGPMPGKLLSGAGVLAPGAAMWMQLVLEPGRYALICFAPDATDGKPHRLHGMIREFAVA